MRGEWRSDFWLLVLILIIAALFVLGRWQPWR
jgi:hypothetical protein